MDKDDEIAIRYSTAVFERAFGKAPEIVVEEMTAGITESSLLLEREVKERTPTSGAGTLRESIGAMPVIFANGALRGGTGTSLSYALPVELGARPHWMPIEPLVDWVERKLHKRGDEAKEVAAAIRYKIAHHGTKARHMFSEGFAANEPQIVKILDARLSRAVARIEGRA